jgi:hypothetical protein
LLDYLQIFKKICFAGLRRASNLSNKEAETHMLVPLKKSQTLKAAQQKGGV